MAAPGLTEAEKHLRQRVNSSRDQDREALYELIRLCAARGDLREAHKLSLRLCAVTPEHPALWLEASQLALKAELWTDAMKAAQTGLKAGSDARAAYRLIAECHERLGRIDDAIVAYRNALSLERDDPGLLNNLGLLLRQSGRLTEARQAFEQARSRGHTIALLNNLANTYRDLGQFELALASYDDALRMEPENIEARFNRGLLFAQINRADDAAKEFATIMTRAPTHLSARLEWCDAQISQGAFDDARAALREIADETPTNGRVWLLLSQITSPELEYHAGCIARLQSLARTAKLPAVEASLMNFALGKLLDDRGAHTQAFQAYQLGNQLTAKAIPRHRRHHWQSLANQTCAQPKELWQTFLAQAQVCEIQPIFVIGMPRSGTTLVEQTLSRGTQVQPAGEIDFFGPALTRLRSELEPNDNKDAVWRLLNSRDLTVLTEGYRARLKLLNVSTETFTDKTPLNFLYVGLLHALFPQAKWVHCTRHPLDTCLSIYFQRFAGLDFAYTLEDIADFYIAYRNCIAYWQQTLPINLVEIRYEELVADPEAQAGRLFEELGLARTHSHSTVHAQPKSISTMSRWQARQRVYTSSNERWKHYQRELAPLRSRLAPYLD